MITDSDKQFLELFAKCSLGSACWTHAAHVRIAWLILETSDSFDIALERLRAAIQKFNSSNNSIGYHETITVAFATVIASRRRRGQVSWAEFSQANSDLFDKTCLKNHYSSGLLATADAKATFVPADLEQLPCV